MKELKLFVTAMCRQDEVPFVEGLDGKFAAG